MTRAEERLAVLLRDAVPEPMHDVTYEAVAQQARMRRRRARSSWGLAAAAAVAVVFAAATVGSNGGAAHPSPGPATTPTAAPTSAASTGSVRFQGVSIAIPAGWHQAEPRMCGLPGDRTVVTDPVETRYVAACPITLPPKVAPLSLSVSEMYGWKFSLGSDGKLVRWHGQPARLSDSVYNGVHEAYLALPWLNAGVTATGPSTAAALALLDNVTVVASASFGVPATADAISIQVFSPSPLPANSAYVTQPVQVSTLLDDLSGGLPVDVAKACPDGHDVVDSAVLTVRAGETFRTFDATFGSCGQVVNGSGHAVTVDSALRDDVYLLLPTTTPPPVVEPAAGCESFGGESAAAGPAAGEPTKRAALAKYLATKPVGYSTDLSSWYEVAAGVFLSGHTELVVVPLAAPRGGFLVDGGSNC